MSSAASSPAIDRPVTSVNTRGGCRPDGQVPGAIIGCARTVAARVLPCAACVRSCVSVGTPAAVRGDVARAGDGAGLAEKALHRAAVGSVIVPIESGAGTPATRRPNASDDSSQISSSTPSPRAAPPPTSPGLAGSVSASA